jgi:hypothetical protein
VDDWHIPQLGQGEERSPELGRRDCRRVPIKNGRQVLAEEIEAGVQELMFGDRGQISRRFVVGETLEHFEKMAGNFGAKTRRSDPADPIQDQEQVGGIGLVRFDQSLGQCEASVADRNLVLEGDRFGGKNILKFTQICASNFVW